MCVRLGFIKPGYAEVYCAHCGYCIGYVHREEVIVSTNLDTGRQTTVNRWFPETNDGDAWSRAHGGGFTDRTDEESNRLFTSGWATFDVRRKSDRDFYDGQVNAFHEMLELCRSMLGYSGTMPSEVPNQSEDAKE